MVLTQQEETQVKLLIEEAKTRFKLNLTREADAEKNVPLANQHKAAVDALKLAFK